MAGEQGIYVRRPGGTVMVAADRVYFSFGDGRLSYGCVTCGAKCCRGFGYSVASGAEAAAHLKTRPAMRLFLEPVDANGLRHSITNCAPSCFFLTEQNLCGLQVDKGMEAKPETCRLFPFNNIWLINGYLVVSPHSSLCPLTVTPPPQRSAHSRHHALVEDMRFRGVASDATDADPSHTVRVAKLIALERTILAASERLLDTDQFDRFVAAQIEATRQAGLHDPAAWLPYGDAAGADVAARHATQVTALLGLAPAAATIQAPEVLRAVIATTPSIRARMLFGTNARAVSNGTVWQLPFVSTGLHLIVGLAREAGLKQITYLTVMDLFHSYRALLALRRREFIDGVEARCRSTLAAARVRGRGAMLRPGSSWTDRQRKRRPESG